MGLKSCCFFTLKNNRNNREISGIRWYSATIISCKQWSSEAAGFGIWSNSELAWVLAPLATPTANTSRSTGRTGCASAGLANANVRTHNSVDKLHTHISKQAPGTRGLVRILWRVSNCLQITHTHTHTFMSSMDSDRSGKINKECPHFFSSGDFQHPESAPETSAVSVLIAGVKEIKVCYKCQSLSRGVRTTIKKFATFLSQCKAYLPTSTDEKTGI